MTTLSANRRSVATSDSKRWYDKKLFSLVLIIIPGDIDGSLSN